MSYKLSTNKRYTAKEIARFYDGYQNIDICLIVEDADDKRDRGMLIPQFDNSGDSFLVYMNGKIYPDSAFDGMELIIIEKVSIKPG
ncbi:hypothetical protein C1631_022765 [Chryseobacterium phosphatilyticum]|uniref:Uncharacterized protein n=1 Tax=Chryseobacterium phosphatilyticum TaxID=475075 RepID=A0A316WUX4_9FLAO|nr:hypothetical protein [Chryseobacterium phosphatilyticum]PWN62390.1 hypothetical protein C1631_022765 [Chryseobacterium phosphatilyticum]